LFYLLVTLLFTVFIMFTWERVSSQWNATCTVPKEKYGKCSEQKKTVNEYITAKVAPEA